MLGKRKMVDVVVDVVKLARQNGPLWLSPSDLKNSVLDNLLVDYLNRVGEKMHGFTRASSEFNTALFDLGNKFENKVMENIRSKGFCVQEITNVRSYEKWPETVSALRAGVPIIYQGPLISEPRRYRGLPDLLVRSDYVNRLFNVPVMEPVATSSCGHIYVVIDIKFSTLPLMKDSMMLRSEPKTRLYKSQLWMYNEMLKEALGYGVDYAFILGRGIERVGQRINVFNHSPGKVVFDEEFSKEMVEIIERKRRMEEKLEYIKFGDPYILPNMKVPEQYDEGWTNAKRIIAERYAEITLLPNCGVKQREKALEMGIANFKDYRCNSYVLGINGPVMSKLVDKVMWINRCINHMIEPLYFGDLEWKKEKGINLYVDFETVGDLCSERFETLPQSQKGNIAFLIGLGWYAEGAWKFKKFMVPRIGFEEERQMFREFVSFVNGMKAMHGGARLFHWGHIEQSHFKKVEGVEMDCEWIDMCKELKSIPVVINGAFGFGLKEYARAMYHNGLINIKWTEGVGSHDIMAMMVGKWGTEVKEEDYVDVIKYNEEDCQVMGEIVRYFRKYH